MTAALGTLLFAAALSSTPTPASAAPSGLAATSFTGIDPGTGLYYTYAPSVIQTNPTTRNILYCGNSTSGVVHDHVYLSVGHLVKGQWVYGPSKDVFGPQDDPNPHGFFSVHACEPEVIGGSFHFGGHPYSWALLFTAESQANNITNQLGVAFANSLAGPWTPDLTPIVQTSDDFGHNNYPFNCPNLYCEGQPAAIDYGGSGHILVSYMSNAGSPGTDAAPSEGLVLRELNLSAVPARGPCPQCLASLPDGKKIEAVTRSGLGAFPPDDASIAYDGTTKQIVISYDDGQPNPTPNEAPVTPYVGVATISESGLLSGTGTWTPLGTIGECISGHALNHNSGLIRLPNGTMPNGAQLSMIYTVANHNLGADWGVWGYRMWNLQAPMGSGLTTQADAASGCSGYDVLGGTGQVNSISAQNYGSSSSLSPAVGLALTPDRAGYYVAHANGTVTTSGDARPQPKPSGMPSNVNSIVGIALDTTTGGYWMADAAGHVYGSNAAGLGSVAMKPHTGTVVAIASSPEGAGYYLVTSTGQVFTFGHAPNFGGLSQGTVGQTITSIAITPDAQGYYLLSATGGITIYGDARYFGPAVLPALNGQATNIAVTSDGYGYLVLSSNGIVTSFGDAGNGRSQELPLGQRGVALAYS
jgi:hypothetical protein